MISILAARGEDELVTDAPLGRLPALLAEPTTYVWVSLTAPVGEPELEVVRDVFKFHPLAIEDCFAEREHPKIDDYDSYIYLITHGLVAEATAEEAEVVELDAFVGARFIVTYHRLPSRSVAGTRDQVLRTGLLLRRGPFAVLHGILDRQVDGLEPLLEGIEQRITQIEDAVFVRPHQRQLESLLAIRGNILQLRRWMSKQRDAVLRLGRGEFSLVKKTEVILFRDVYDHIVRFNDLLENYREMTDSMVQAYLSVTSNRLSEIMRFLTVFTATLMPLTVITGIYGMNFEHMPELRQPWGYYATLGVMAAAAFGVFGYFYRRGWVGKPPEMPPAPQIELPAPREAALRPR